MGDWDTTNPEPSRGSGLWAAEEEIYMTRERTKSGDTGFNCVVYGEESMAKETVSTRVPVAVGKQVDRYAETHDISRTDAIEVFIRAAAESDSTDSGKRAYTVRKWEVGAARDSPLTVGGVEGALHSAVEEMGEWDEMTAISARLPTEVVAEIAGYATAYDVSKSEAAREMLVEGLERDPLPEGSEDPLPDEVEESETTVNTLELDAEDADKFRRMRLRYRMGPSEAVHWLQQSNYSTSEARIGFGKPDNGGE